LLCQIGIWDIFVSDNFWNNKPMNSYQ